MKTTLVCYEAELEFPFPKEDITISVEREYAIMLGIQWPGVSLPIDKILAIAIAGQKELDSQVRYLETVIDNDRVYARFSSIKHRNITLYNVLDVAEFYRLFGDNLAIYITYDHFEKHFVTQLSFEDGR